MNEVEEYDYVVSGGAVAGVEGVIMTFSGLYEAETDEGIQQYVSIRVGRNPRQKCTVGDVLDLGNGIRLEVAHLAMPSDNSQQGKVYFRQL